MSKPAQRSRVGTQFGCYQLGKLLGRGGMGEVYEAYDTTKDRTVALKLLPEHLAADARYRERFRRESRTAARLREPHIIPIHDYGEIDGLLFIDMRLVEGENLGGLLKRHGPMAPARAVAIIAQVAAALDAAHAEGLIHRDIKPANILVTQADFAYLVDFGIAHSTTGTALTGTGTAVGTYSYMAPERFKEDEVTYRADIYSLACVLHECLTATRPYRADSVQVLITAHLFDPIPRPSAVHPGTPTAFDAVIARGMAKDPADRYPSAGDLARAAHEALTDTDQHIASTILASVATPMQPPEPPPSGPLPGRPSAPSPRVPNLLRRRWIPVLAVVLTVAAAGGGIVYWKLFESVGHPTTATTVTATIPVGNGSIHVAVDPGTHTVYTANRDDNSVSVIDPAAHTVAATISVGKWPLGVAVDPGTHTVYTANRDDNSVSVIDPAAHTVAATISVGTWPEGVAVDPGTHTVYTTNYQDATVSVIDAAAHAVTATIPVGKSPIDVAVDPGTHTVYTTNYDDATVSVIDPAAHTVAAVIPVGKGPDGLAVDPRTHTVYITNKGGDSVSVINPAHAVTATIPVGKGPEGVAVDPGTHTVYTANMDGDSVSVIDPAAHAVTATIPVGKGPVGVAVDPGTHTVYTAIYDQNSVSVIEPRR
ncbi:serine/threonine-protein kinase [Nocardia niigatensis]|uniref:serine/threonine-protein kinase n=1 Tax=Nocardia niigatensis TaxID=209249 RepID=UPI0005941241|nr:protein kinase [Nocardia niigatensis]